MFYSPVLRLLCYRPRPVLLFISAHGFLFLSIVYVFFLICFPFLFMALHLALFRYGGRLSSLISCVALEFYFLWPRSLCLYSSPERATDGRSCMNMIECVVFSLSFFPVRSHQIPHFVRAFPRSGTTFERRVCAERRVAGISFNFFEKKCFPKFASSRRCYGCIGRILQHRLLSASVSHGGQLLACRFLFAALVVCFCGSISSFRKTNYYLTLFLFYSGLMEWSCTEAELVSIFLVSLLGIVLPSVPARWISSGYSLHSVWR